ncbi:hypothetical protein [Xanthomonas campestris]|uniref:hypothetical protein n=1 Tax=Xanthomonas campestris TaxID=339 RepID=UPI002B22B04C|nr:hypothetical protein [Xanthomonas campestris]MEA9562518.1 hypothetical protein [Xanthomonas campestris]MEA9725146.1 hypothetical protein [Xanthomonas campestris]MEB1886554.1 hypothetical protein [Xanthomonas campestris pv. campestris]
MRKNWPEILLAGAAIVLLSRALLSKRNAQGATRSNILVPSKEPLSNSTPALPVQKNSIVGKILAVANRAETKLDRVLNGIPAWVSATVAFVALIFAAVVAFVVRKLPPTGPTAPMNLVFLSVILFFAAVGIVPKTNARFWSLFGAIVGIFMWIIALCNDGNC